MWAVQPCRKLGSCFRPDSTKALDELSCADICLAKGCATASCRTYRKVMQEASLLGNVIRLVDYMLVEGTVDRVIITVEELLSTLEAPRTSQDKMQKVNCAA